MIEQIQIACRTHGAKAVSDAAYAAMEGRRELLEQVGLGHLAGAGMLHQITAECFELMTPAEKAAELANATITSSRMF
mgnify:CR=1 FL=1